MSRCFGSLAVISDHCRNEGARDNGRAELKEKKVAKYH